MENEFIPFTGDISPVTGKTLVQLKLSNDNQPIDYADVFHWGRVGRGGVYPHIESYRIATEEEYREYQERKAKHRAKLK